jgi:plasmid stabilization system protein ParE
MSGRFDIRYLQTAEKDIDDIFTYIMRDKPFAAKNLLKMFDKSISQLSFNPEMGVIPKDERLKNLGYRMLIIDGYLVFYVIKAKIVQIRRIIHGARQYNFLL